MVKLSKSCCDVYNQIHKRTMRTVSFGLLSLVFLLTGCAKPQFVATYKSTESRDFEPRQGVVVTPLVAEMKVLSERSVKDSVVFDILVETIPVHQIASWVNECKKDAMSMMMKKYKADAIVAPLTEVSTTEEGLMKIVISGYPAIYQNFRNATSADSWMVPMYTIIDKNASDPINHTDTKISVVK